MVRRLLFAIILAAMAFAAHDRAVTEPASPPGPSADIAAAI